MSKWKEYKLGETLISANTGLDAIKRAPIVSRDTGIKCLRIQDISQNKQYEDWGFTEVLDNNFTKFKLLANDIIVARTGATVGVNMIIKGNLNSVFNNGLIRLRAKDEFNSLYIYYLLRSSDYWSHINSIAFGTTSQPNIQINQLLSFKVKVPDFANQTLIAEILSSLDEKIELNNKMNQELESLAKLLFKRWFVDFEFPNENGEPYKSTGGEMVDSELGEIPKGWEVVQLSKVLTVKYGKDHKHLNDGKFPLYGSGGIMRFVEKPLYEKDSILIPRKGTLTNLFYVVEPFWSVDTMFYTEIHNPIYGKYLFHTIKGLDIASMNVGSAVPSLTTKILNDLKVINPTDDILFQFDNLITSIYVILNHNLKENGQLENLRDTILPKLISGELQINNN
jgi:type I restriction enzyme S subunit